MSLDVYIILPKQEHSEWQTKRARSLEEAGEMKGLTPLIGSITLTVNRKEQKKFIGLI